MVNKFSFGSEQAGKEAWRKNASLSGKVNERAAETAVDDRRYVLNTGLSLKDGKLVVSDKFKQQALDEKYEFDVEQTASGVSVKVKKKSGETYKTLNFKSKALNAIGVKALLTGAAAVDPFQTAAPMVADSTTLSTSISGGEPVLTLGAIVPAVAPVTVMTIASPVVAPVSPKNVAVTKSPREELSDLLNTITLSNCLSDDSLKLLAQLEIQINDSACHYEQSSATAITVGKLLTANDIDPDLVSHLRKLTEDLGIVAEIESPVVAAATPAAVVTRSQAAATKLSELINPLKYNYETNEELVADVEAAQVLSFGTNYPVLIKALNNLLKHDELDKATKANINAQIREIKKGISEEAAKKTAATLDKAFVINNEGLIAVSPDFVKLAKRYKLSKEQGDPNLTITIEDHNGKPVKTFSFEEALLADEAAKLFKLTVPKVTAPVVAAAAPVMAPFRNYAELANYVTKKDTYQHKAITKDGSLVIGCTAQYYSFGYHTKFIHYSIESTDKGPVIKAQESKEYETYSSPWGKFDNLTDFNKRLKDDRLLERSTFMYKAKGIDRAFSAEENLAQVRTLAQDEARSSDKAATKLLEAYDKAMKDYKAQPKAIPVPVPALPGFSLPTLSTNFALPELVLP